MRHKILIITFLCAVTLQLGAQTQVTGTVMDGTIQGEPLPGATIRVPGTQAGTITDSDGKFILQVPAGRNIIQVSMMGYATKAVNIRGKSHIQVTLIEESKVLEDVVVIGYGSMKKRDLTGSMSQINGTDLMRGATTDVAHGLQGKIAGVEVRQNDGSPGAGTSITVRGANSFSTSTQPLYIIDGVPYGTDPNGIPKSDANGGNNQSVSPLSMINPNDIDKIEVLKDASATAIYGSRGANGVVIITTKKGQATDAGRPKVEFNANWGLQTVARRLRMLDPYTYALYQNEAVRNARDYEGNTTTPYPYRGEWTYTYVDGQPDYTTGRYNPSPEDFLNPGTRTDQYGNIDEVAIADWQDQIFRTGFRHDYSISISNGSDRGWYSISGNYASQQGIVRATGHDRYGLSLNIGRHITKWLEVGTSSFFTHTTTDFQRTNSENTGIIRSALIFPPTYGVHTATEQLDELNWLATNPVRYVEGASDRLRQISWFSSSYAEARICPWLKFRQNIGLGYNSGNRGTYYDRHTQEGKPPYNGRGGKATNTWKSFTAESILTADKTWGIHTLNAVAGITFEGGEGETTSMTATNFPNDYTRDSDMSLAIDRPTIASSKTRQSLMSVLARINYSLMGKYLFTASVRTDGSSSFATRNKWATFTSGAIAWRASDENFIRNLNVFDNLKFRLSFGQTGNQGIGSYRTLTVLNAANYPYNGTLSSGAAMIDWRGPANPDLRWETTNQFNAGIDFGFLGNRLRLTLDYYYKYTRDLLQNVTIPSSTGFSQMLVNRGNVTNQGLEVTLDYDVFVKTPVQWTFSANLALNRNRIGGLDGDQFATSLWNGADQVFLQRNGCPIGTLYGYVEDGFYDNIAEVRSIPEYATLSDAEALKRVGEIKYRDLNGDGKITAADRTIIGNTNPDFTYSFTNHLQWRGLSLDFMLQGSQGNDILNYNLTDIQMSNYGNITQEAYDSRWTPDHKDQARWPKATSGYSRAWYISNRHVENGSYMKMKYLTLSYTWQKPAKWLRQARISLTANNLFCITRYSWFDPDVNAGGTNTATPGVDSYSYPSSRSFTLGVGLTF